MISNNEIIAGWLGWNKFVGNPELSRDLDFKNNLENREAIKLHLHDQDASIRLIRRARRAMCWRLVVGLQGAPPFDREHRSEGVLWAWAALHFARAANDNQ